MPIFPNHTKQQLDAGKVTLGMGMRVLRGVDAGMIAKTTGFDWLFIDMEHSSMDVDLASQVAVTAMAMGVTPIVRVPGKEHHHASRLLDSGAQGIVVPHVDTAEEAARGGVALQIPTGWPSLDDGRAATVRLRVDASSRGRARLQRTNTGDCDGGNTAGH